MCSKFFSKVRDKHNNYGFTLVELLLLLAVLGILATLVLVLVNPLEQLQKGRDAKRKTIVGGLYKSLLSYYVTRGAIYPGASSTWLDILKESSNLHSIPSAINYQSGVIECTGGATGEYKQNGFCYFTNGSRTESVVYTKLETFTEKAKCTGANEEPYYLWSSAMSKAGTVCLNPADEPFDPGAAYEFKD